MFILSSSNGVTISASANFLPLQRFCSINPRQDRPVVLEIQASMNRTEK
jgi:hypothetical protein